MPDETTAAPAEVKAATPAPAPAPAPAPVAAPAAAVKAEHAAPEVPDPTVTLHEFCSRKTKKADGAAPQQLLLVNGFYSWARGKALFSAKAETFEKAFAEFSGEEVPLRKGARKSYADVVTAKS